jgi:hypothetical protein
VVGVVGGEGGGGGGGGGGGALLALRAGAESLIVQPDRGDGEGLVEGSAAFAAFAALRARADGGDDDGDARGTWPNIFPGFAAKKAGAYAAAADGDGDGGAADGARRTRFAWEARLHALGYRWILFANPRHCPWGGNWGNVMLSKVGCLLAASTTRTCTSCD